MAKALGTTHRAPVRPGLVQAGILQVPGLCQMPQARPPSPGRLRVPWRGHAGRQAGARAGRPPSHAGSQGTGEVGTG